MGELLVEEKQIVFPGQELAEGMDFLPGKDVLREKDKLIALKVGILNLKGRLVKVIPLSGTYIPKRGDTVIGKVVNIGTNGWRVNIGWAYEANISLRDGSSDFIEKGTDLSKYYDYGDYVVTEITKVIDPKLIDLSMKGPGLRRLHPGRIFQVVSSKVPRIIGKQGSMISMIKDQTGCKISVGQNGVVWLSGEDPAKELLAYNAIRKIENESHIPGLTERIKEFLEKGGK